MIVTFEDRIDSDLVFFIMYLTVGVGHELHFLKKLFNTTRSMLTNESEHERTFGFKLHYKNDKQLSMMERMQGQIPKLINPFDKGVISNIVEFFIPVFSGCCGKKKGINVQTGNDLMAPRVKSANRGGKTTGGNRKQFNSLS